MLPESEKTGSKLRGKRRTERTPPPDTSSIHPHDRLRDVQKFGDKFSWMPVLVALVVTAISVIGLVFATPSVTSPLKAPMTFAAKVAAIPGLDQPQVANTLAQASREIRDYELTILFSRLVEEGKISHSQVDRFFRERWALPGHSYLSDETRKAERSGHRPGHPGFKRIDLPLLPNPTSVTDET